MFQFTQPRSSIYAAGVLLCAGLCATPATAQDFDCRAASTATEHAICGSGRLSALDERMTQLYDRLWSTLGNNGAREGLREYQRMFLAARNRCGRHESCIRGAYLDQIEVLNSRLRYSALGHGD
jgi:uncharacterized protein